VEATEGEGTETTEATEATEGGAEGGTETDGDAKETKQDTGDRDNDPLNWREKIDPKSGRKFYLNRTTKKTTWQRPACLDTM